MKEMWVLNPRLAGNRNACLVYPHDVKRALGISGTVHERFITPQRLGAARLDAGHVLTGRPSFPRRAPAVCRASTRRCSSQG